MGSFASSEAFTFCKQRVTFDHLCRLGVFPPCWSHAAAGLVPRTRLVRRHLPPLCASAGLQVLNGFPDSSGGHLPAGELLDGFHTRQVFQISTSRDPGHVAASAASSCVLRKVAVPSSRSSIGCEKPRR